MASHKASQEIFLLFLQILKDFTVNVNVFVLTFFVSFFIKIVFGSILTKYFPNIISRGSKMKWTENALKRLVKEVSIKQCPLNMAPEDYLFIFYFYFF